MRLGKAGVLHRCHLECRWASGSSRGASSSSPLAPRPRSVLEWQKELSLPSPSSQALLGKLFWAIQSPFPPIRQNQVWIEAQDVEATLKFVLPEKLFVNRSERKEMLDVIMLCMQRCLKDARRRATVNVEVECERQGVVLSDAEKEARVDNHPAVREWQQLISSRWLSQHRLQNVIMARRRSHIEDLQDAFSIVQQGGTFGQHELNQLLNFIARFIPTPKESEKKERFLEKAPIPRELQLNVLDQANRIGREQPNLEKLLDDHKDDYLLPQEAVRLFEVVWVRLCHSNKPDAASYGSALLMESKLAPWRGLLSDSVDLFEPLRRVSNKLQRKKLLETNHINQLMWATLRYNPALQHSNDMSRDVEWPDRNECLKLYQEMRGNAVQVEMEWERRQSGESTSPRFGAGQWQNNTITNSLLQRQKGLPIQILPDQITYELLIRGFAWQGDFRRAASILDDMTQSSVDTRERFIKLRRGKVDSKEKEPPSPLYSATLSTFDSLFRGFSKHSIPYNLVHFDAQEPGASEWEALGGKEEEENDWSIQDLISLFEAYLDLDPSKCREALEDYRPLAVAKKRTWNFEDQVDKDDWFLDLDDSMIHAWDSILSLENPDADNKKACPAPTPNQLFFVLTALRRTSNDNAQWVLGQWQRVVDKFSGVSQTSDSSLGIEGKGSTGINKVGWTGWKLNDRLVRVLEHLRSKL